MCTLPHCVVEFVISLHLSACTLSQHPLPAMVAASPARAKGRPTSVLNAGTSDKTRVPISLVLRRPNISATSPSSTSSER
ncbi:hypothetical protein B0T16DRAFT_399885 [Cercophora newfieldiana]|uniref:Secreted protein n=1 Tax=Cercophora newfieldiana TaxID=92897 RepID=A0AA39YQ69_9PEZI|nr:hypothetical protein B0T16DRAFT_399885 [Cercophora newfieldiana]